MSTYQDILANTTALGASWILTAPRDLSPAESTFSVVPSSLEFVFEPDNRTPVDLADYQDGGKYRSIVKLFIRYEAQEPASDARWGVATGYLISPDTLITAGHCVFDKALGRAVQMKSYIGYSGRTSFADPTGSVQARRPGKVVTTTQWIVSGDPRYDVAFVKLDRPFDGAGTVRGTASSSLRPFTLRDTPPRQSGILIGIVGYPIDRSSGGEKGAEMYELYETVNYDLGKSPRNMLRYRISAFSGQDGGPVIDRSYHSQDGRMAVIGTHCLGGDSTNAATAIGGEFGINYSLFIQVLDAGSPDIIDISGLPPSGSKPTPPPVDEPGTPLIDKPSTPPPVDKPHTPPPVDKPTTPPPVNVPTNPPVDKPSTPPGDKTTPTPGKDEPSTPPGDQTKPPKVDDGRTFISKCCCQ